MLKLDTLEASSERSLTLKRYRVTFRRVKRLQVDECGVIVRSRFGCLLQIGREMVGLEM